MKHTMTSVILTNPAENTENLYREILSFIYDEYAGCIYGLALKAVQGEEAIAEAITVQTFDCVFRELHYYRRNYIRLFSFIYGIFLNVINANGYPPERPRLAVNKSI